MGEEFQLIRFLYAIASGSAIAVIFDVAFFYLLFRFLPVPGRQSDDIYGSKFQMMFREIRWQVINDVLIVMTLGFLSYIVGSHGSLYVLVIGVVIGLLDIRLLRALYSGLVSRKSLIILIFSIAFIQKVLTSITVWVVYWWPKIS
jgi:hypothetical protein